MSVPPLEPRPRKRARVRASEDFLAGIGSSPGKARGPVRVVHDASRGVRIEPGEILVAPYTDPAWTPLFLSAGAVVVEIGSLLSHASIVARELGIPSVVAVAGATTALHDGEWVEVDGTAGSVRRVPEDVWLPDSAVCRAETQTRPRSSARSA